MKNDHAFEALLTSALNRRGAPAPFSVDVLNRVMGRVAALGPPTRTEMDRRQFGRWAAAAAIIGAALTAAAAWQGPSLGGVASDLGNTMALTISAALKLASPFGALAGTLGRVVLALVASAQTLVQPLVPFKPLAQTAVAATAAAMMGVTIFVVGRDVRAHIAE